MAPRVVSLCLRGGFIAKTTQRGDADIDASARKLASNLNGADTTTGQLIGKWLRDRLQQLRRLRTSQATSFQVARVSRGLRVCLSGFWACLCAVVVGYVTRPE